MNIPEGWFPWYGGKDPFSVPTLVKVMFNDGAINHKPWPSNKYVWEHNFNNSNIVAYLPVTE